MKLRAHLGAVGFWCPGCRCAHYVNNTWTISGPAEAPTISPSVRVCDKYGTLCHLFLRAGSIEFLDDCGHELAGKTVPLPDFPVGDGAA